MPAMPPLGWYTSGLYRFGDVWIALAEGPAFEDYLSGSGRFAEQALHRLTDRLRERTRVRSRARLHTLSVIIRGRKSSIGSW